MMNSISPDEFTSYEEQQTGTTSNNSQQNQPSSQPLQYNNTTTVHQQTSTAAIHHQQPVYKSHQQARPVYNNNTNNVNRSMSNSNSGSSGGPLYNNLIPGHYRYGVKPPEPPPGPLSYSNISISRAQSNSYNARQQSLGQQSIDNNRSYQNTSTQQQQNNNDFDIIQVLEPDDDDYIGIDSSSIDIEEDDEQYYRPFRHTSTTNVSSGVGVSMRSVSISNSEKTSKKKKKKSKQVQHQQQEERPVDLLAVLLNDCTQADSKQQGDGSNDIATLISEASTKSQRARALTNSLAAKQYQSGDDSTATVNGAGIKKDEGNEEDDNDLYATTSNAHTDAAIAFQRVYRILLGLDETSSSPPSSSSVPALSTRTHGFKPLSQSEELAKSMILLSNIHVRMSKSLIDMGMKWNMGKFDSQTGRMITKKSGDMSCGTNVDGKKKGTAVVSSDGNKSKDDSKTSAKDETSSDTSTATSNTTTEAQHERLRMAVRGALDTTNHEEDLTNSTFLARSTLMNNTKTSSKSKQQVTKSKNKLLASTARASGNIMNRVLDPKKKSSNIDPNNPVDDLMKLEKELQCMDMQLEMGNSVANLNSGGNGVRPDGSFMVVPTGSGASFMSSSSMWTSGILTAGGGNAQQQQHSKPPPNGRTNPRSRANHLQSFQGNKQVPSSSQRPQIAAGLDQSWWGGGQASILASSAIATAASNTSTQHPPHTSESTNGTSDPPSTNQASSSTNTKQLMQLMDSLNRLGNENAQLMREVEDAKAARAEAKAAKDMMSKFKNEYSSRFNKVKEALTKYPQNNNAAGGDNPVVNSAYMKSASMLEIKKRDQMIKKLSADLKKERDDAKKKDSSLQKYEAFYREVKARSAEKARQRQQAQEQQQKKQQQQFQQKRSNHL